MKIFERPNGRREECASLANIGYHMLEVNLEGEVYTYVIPGIEDGCKAERVCSDKWKIITCDVLGNPIECVIRTDVLVGCAWCNVDEKLWENSTYVDTIRRCKEFFSIPPFDIRKTKYQTKNGFSYYVTKNGDVWSTEFMVKLKGSIDRDGYRYVRLCHTHHFKVHRLVAYHFVSVPDDLLAQGLTEETLVVNHIDGNKLNNRWDNLEWTTQKGNLTHASINGLLHTTIDKQLLERIWQLLEEGYSDSNISRETGISVSTVSAIRQGTIPRYRTDKYTWSKHSPGIRVLDKDTIFSIYDDFTYTDKKNCELSRKYNVSYHYIYALRVGHRCSNLAREYITSKGLDRYWKGFSPPK